MPPHVTDFHTGLLQGVVLQEPGAERIVQATPSALVMTVYPLPSSVDVATHSIAPVGPPHVTACHVFCLAASWLVQEIPSGLVITQPKTCEHELDTATNWRASLDPPQATAAQVGVLEAAARSVQKVPFGLVITLFPGPDDATATKSCASAGPPQAMPDHEISAADDRLVQDSPSGLVIT